MEEEKQKQIVDKRKNSLQNGNIKFDTNFQVLKTGDETKTFMPQEFEEKIFEKTRVFPENVNQVWSLFNNQEIMTIFVLNSLPFSEEVKSTLKITSTISQSISFKKSIYYYLRSPKTNTTMSIHITLLANSLENSSISTMQIFISKFAENKMEKSRKFVEAFGNEVTKYLESHKQIIKNTESTLIRHNINEIWREIITQYRMDIAAGQYIHDLKINGKPDQVGTEVTFYGNSGILYKKIISRVEGNNDSIRWYYGTKNITGADSSVGTLLTLIKVKEYLTFITYDHYFTSGVPKNIYDLMTSIKKEIFENTKKYLDNFCTCKPKNKDDNKINNSYGDSK